MRQQMTADVPLNEVVVDSISQLNERGVHTALCTNNLPGVDAWRKASENLPFDVVVASSEIGLRKPDEAIFELMSALGWTPTWAPAYGARLQVAKVLAVRVLTTLIASLSASAT